VQQLPATLFGIESILIRSVGALFHLLAPAQLGSGSSFGLTLGLARLRIRLGSSVPRWFFSKKKERKKNYCSGQLILCDFFSSFLVQT
jgi:hypothetical protein